ncbi:MAG: hypothetical protein GY721_07365, partial [Deltaproteobacteria bacterium]|nr:hypothetical protein [Deltaproteobacteria bacterium]
MDRILPLPQQAQSNSRKRKRGPEAAALHQRGSSSFSRERVERVERVEAREESEQDGSTTTVTTVPIEGPIYEWGRDQGGGEENEEARGRGGEENEEARGRRGEENEENEEARGRGGEENEEARGRGGEENEEARGRGGEENEENEGASMGESSGEMGDTPLLLTEMLIEYGLKEMRKKNKQWFLYRAFLNFHKQSTSSKMTLALLRLCLDLGFDPSDESSSYETFPPLLHYFCKRGGGSPRYADKGDGCHPHHHFDTAIIRLLLDHGADLHQRDSYGATALHCACDCFHRPFIHSGVVECLIEKGGATSTGLINAQDSDGRTALHYACSSKDESIVTFLVNKGADVNLRDKRGKTALHYAVCERSLYTLDEMQKMESIVKFLVERGADLTRDCDLETPLSYASWEREEYDDEGEGTAAADASDSPNRRNEVRKAIISFLIEKGMDVNGRYFVGKSPLYVACRIGYISLVKFLVEKGADLNVRWDGKTPLHVAIEEGQTKLVRWVIEEKVELIDFALKDWQGYTLLGYACEYLSRKDDDIILTLLKTGRVDPHDELLEDRYGTDDPVMQYALQLRS